MYLPAISAVLAAGHFPLQMSRHIYIRGMYVCTCAKRGQIHTVFLQIVPGLYNGLKLPLIEQHRRNALRTVPEQVVERLEVGTHPGPGSLERLERKNGRCNNFDEVRDLDL